MLKIEVDGRPVEVAHGATVMDAADQHELLFSVRREGLYFAGLGFAGKAATGLGVMVAGAALDMIHFPRSLGPAAGAPLAEGLQFRLVAIWGPVPAIIAIISLAVLASYGITRAQHDKIAAALRR